MRNVIASTNFRIHSMAELSRMKSLGIVTGETRMFGTHIAHHSNGVHEDEAEKAQALGYDIAYDGLSVDI